jgi:hypothetical protein
MDGIVQSNAKIVPLLGKPALFKQPIAVLDLFVYFVSRDSRRHSADTQFPT